jgi:diadenosine tetraphosphate (Ap4A) HIT family hydrolase
MTAPGTCDACSGRWPDPADFVADLGETTAHLHVDQFFPGWTVLVLKRHATELFQLHPDERARLIEEVSRAAAAVQAAFQAVKVNYALLGNLLPHVHWHVIPRLAADPSPRQSVWEVPHDPARLAPAARAERIAHLRAHLDPRPGS